MCKLLHLWLSQMPRGEDIPCLEESESINSGATNPLAHVVRCQQARRDGLGCDSRSVPLDGLVHSRPLANATDVTCSTRSTQPPRDPCYTALCFCDVLILSVLWLLPLFRKRWGNDSPVPPNRCQTRGVTSRPQGLQESSEAATLLPTPVERSNPSKNSDLGPGAQESCLHRPEARGS